MLWKNVLADLEQAKGLAEEARKLCFSPGGPYLYDDAISSDLLLIRDAQEKALTGDFDGTRAGSLAVRLLQDCLRRNRRNLWMTF